MFCEIYIKHKQPITTAELVAFVNGGQLGAVITTAAAHTRSAFYAGVPAATSLAAHETVNNCFAILRNVAYNTSTFHLEGNSTTVTVETLLEAAQMYAIGHLVPALKRSRSLRGALVSAKLFEDNGKETGLVGRPPSPVSLFKEQFDISEIHSHLIVLLTAFISFRLGSKWDTVRDAEVSLVIGILYSCINGFLKYWWRRHKLKFGFSWS